MHIQPDICDSLLPGPSSYALRLCHRPIRHTILVSLHVLGTGCPVGRTYGLGIMFGVAGMFSYGLVFVPLAALCGVVAFFRGACAMPTSWSGVGLSIVAAFLTIAGFVMTPSLWVAVSGFLVFAQHH